MKMKAAVFVEPGRIVLDEKPIPDIGPLDALVRITTTTICGTDIHILKGEYPVERGLTIGHEPVGVIEKLGSAVQGYREGQRVIAGAITPSGYSNACLCGCLSQDGAGTKHGFKAIVVGNLAIPSMAARRSMSGYRTQWQIWRWFPTTSPTSRC
jgi:alcohol dehydrogenase